jgi:hypothetical protein
MDASITPAKEAIHREGEVAGPQTPGDVLERDAGFLERGHQPHDVRVGRRVEPVLLAGREEAERRDPFDLRRCAGHELRKLLGRHACHRPTLVTRSRVSRCL